MSLSIIAAISQNNCIGKDNKLPWHIPEDLKHFKKLTLGKAVLMGRKTFESILTQLGKPLPGRKNLVITRQTEYRVPDGVEVYGTVEEALQANANEEIMVIGGAEMYRQLLPQADALYITEIKKIVNGDAFFPVVDVEQWQEEKREKYEEFDFIEYRRK